MAVPGRFSRSVIGADPQICQALVGNGAPQTYAMASLNTGLCFRFTAPDTRDIASVYVKWSSVSSPGTVTLRIETIDATTGKPSGSLYDASATLAFTPVAGWQILTFSSLPTAGLTAGTEYAIVLLTTTGGTTQTVHHSHSTSAATMFPSAVLTAADGTTRSNFSIQNTHAPVCSVVFEDSVEELLGFFQFGARTSYNIFGTAAAGMKFVVPTGQTWSVAGVSIPYVLYTGTPAGDLRCRILNSSSVAVSGSTVTIDKDSLIGATSSRRTTLFFPGLVSLAAGTYRVIFDSASSANSSNCWNVHGLVARASGLIPSGLIATNTADVTAGTISWTDTATEQAAINLVIDDVASGGTTIAGTPLLRGLAH